MDSYFETSALVKLLVREEGSDLADQLWDESTRQITSPLSYAEVRAALAAVHRVRRISSEDHEVAKRALDTIFGMMYVVDVTDALVRRAGDLAEEHSLRGYDAVHLSSAAHLGRQILLVTWDRELGRAGRLEGLSIAGVQ